MAAHSLRSEGPLSRRPALLNWALVLLGVLLAWLLWPAASQ